MPVKQTKNLVETAQEIKKLRSELEFLNFDMVQGKIKNIHLPREIRKKIARLLTKIHKESYHA